MNVKLVLCYHRVHAAHFPVLRLQHGLPGGVYRSDARIPVLSISLSVLYLLTTFEVITITKLLKTSDALDTTTLYLYRFSLPHALEFIPFTIPCSTSFDVLQLGIILDLRPGGPAVQVSILLHDP